MQVSRNASLCNLVNRINLELLTFGHATVDPGWHGIDRSPVFSRLYYISGGSFSICNSNYDKFLLESGKWYLIPSGYSFDYKCNETMEHFYFHIKLYDFDGTDLLRNCKKPLSLEAYKSFDYPFMSKCITSDNLSDGLLLRQTVFDILLSFIEEYGISISAEDYSPCIYKSLVYIKQNLSMQLTISEIAENAFVAKSTLTKHFKKELSMSVNEYICNTIMAEAERLLMTSNISILELSQKFGYIDQLYFSRRFKEKFGKSPREYRKEKLL